MVVTRLNDEGLKTLNRLRRWQQLFCGSKGFQDITIRKFPVHEEETRGKHYYEKDLDM